jgi:hypothetical protein
MPCFIRLSRMLGLDLPPDERFLEWFERQLMGKFKAKSHKELEKALTAKYHSDSWSLKLLFQELIVAYKLKVKPKRKLLEALEESGIVFNSKSPAHLT